MTHYTHVNVFLFTALILRAPLVLCHPNMYNQFSISTERKLERERERESGRREREWESERRERERESGRI